MTASTLLMLLIVVVLLISFMRLWPHWTERDAYLKGRAYVYRRNAQSCTILIWTDAALVLLNVLAIVLGNPFWIANLINAVVVAAVGYGQWRVRNAWLRKMELVLALEVMQANIPDHPPEDLT